MEPFLGEIRILSSTFAPSGWALCNGQLITILSNQALFSILGNRYGGDGKVNFALPDLRGKVAIGFNAAYPQGTSGGLAANTLTSAQMPPHTHELNVGNLKGSVVGPAGNYFANGPTGDNDYATANSVTTAFNSQVISTVGAAAPVPNMQPYLTLSYIIALDGIYPPRP